MPPKKSAINSDAGSPGGKVIWEGANDIKLLLLTQGRYVETEEYKQLSSAFPGTTTGSIRNRISALRVRQRDLYEQLGWPVPEGGAGHSKPGAAAQKKRGVSESTGAEETPRKKRIKKAKTEEEDAEEESEDMEVEG